MRIRLQFDDEDLITSARDRHPPFFGIYWEHEGLYYPEKNWLDSGSVVIGLWLSSAKSIKNGSLMEELRFLDGPYSLIIENEEGLASIKTTRFVHHWIVPVEEIIEQITDAAETLKRKYQHLKIFPEQQQNIARFLSQF